MALIEEVFETSVPGVIAGALATAVVLPMVGFGGRRRTQSDGAGNGPLRSLAKTVIRGYVTVADKAKEVATETRETLGDLVAEVRAEREAAARNQPQPEEAPASDKGSGRPSGPSRRARHSTARRSSRSGSPS
jgi:hypothetical protein